MRAPKGLSHSLVLAVDAESQALAIGWLRLAVASLMVAGLFAVLVAVARTPGIQSIVGEEYFRVSLVGHVVFSLNVWLMSFAGALWVLLATRAGVPFNTKLGRLSLGLATAGAAIMAMASVAGLGTPSLVDYIPLLEHPVFAAGLAAFFGGVGLSAINFLVAMRRALRPLSLEAQAMRMGAVAYLMAMATLVVAFNVGWIGEWSMAAWGPGHLLQLVNAATMIAAWILLLRITLPSKFHALLSATLPLFLLPVVIVPLMYLRPGPLSMGPVGTITWVGLGVPTMVAWLAVGSAVFRGRSSVANITPLLVSMLLFSVGVLAAVLGLEGDTRVTAHYHGTVGAVTVALMGLTFRLLPALGFRVRLPKLAAVQPLIYGSGLLLIIAGLFWASNFGGQRKAFEAFAENSSALGPMGLFGTGALLAVAGGAAFVLGAGASMLARIRKPSPIAEEPSLAPELTAVGPSHPA